jgi:hypothetical protein
MIAGAVKEMVTEEQFIKFGDWSDLKMKLEQCHLFSTEDDFLDYVGMKRDFFDEIISFAVNGWRNSTSRSMFQIIGHHGLEIPQQGTKIFKSHLEQTRFFYLLDEARILSKMVLGHVVDENNDKVRVAGGNVALTYPNNELRRRSMDETVNQVLQVIFIYAFLCTQKNREIKFPKKLYRGIRLSDMGKIPGLKEELSELTYEPSKRDEYHRIRTEIIKDFIERNGLNSIAESPLLSFSSSKSVASYFANKTGFVLEIEVKDVDILTSCLHDERLDVYDYMSGKHEKEFIVKPPQNRVEVRNIIVEDLDYLVAVNHPMSVNYFDHNDKMAYYELNETRIKAQYQWASNTKGSIRYYNLDDEQNYWGYGSREFKQEFGFSPVITNKNIKEIKNFRIERK